MKKVKHLVFALLPVVCFTACSKTDPDSPGTEFMPDMYRSTSYEANSSNPNFEDGVTNRQPVAGTIALGHMPYPYSNDSLGYELAGHWYKLKVAATPENISKGQTLYGKFCNHCHGESGQGDGHMVNIGKYPAPPPSYTGALKNLPEGKIMHTLQYGKGMMGSHASQLSLEERELVARYVQTLQGVDFTKASSDSVYMQRSGRLNMKQKDEKK